MVWRIHAQAFLSKCVYGHRLFVDHYLILMIGLLSDDAKLFWVADKEKLLAILEVAIVDELGQIEFMLFRHANVLLILPIGNSYRAINAFFHSGTRGVNSG